MDHEEIIEKLYDISAVEGVAWFSGAGNLTENQLSISEKAVREIGKVLYQMREGLSGAERLLKGLLLKTEKRAFMCFLQGNTLILLELDSDVEVDGVYSSLSSLVGPAVSNEISQVIPKKEVISGGAEVADPEEEASLDLVSKAEFQKILFSCFKQVSTMQLAKKLIADSMDEIGVPDSAERISKEQATAVALAASEKIPNKARRSILKKELKIILDKFLA